MNVLKALIAVMMMQLATILKGVTPAFVTLDTQGMDFLVQVSADMFYYLFQSIMMCVETSDLNGSVLQSALLLAVTDLKFYLHNT